MDDDDDLAIHGTGPRLISLAEAAAILRVDEQAVRDWIAEGLISYVTMPDGEHRIQVRDESQESSPGVSSSFVAFELGRGISEEAQARFVAERERRRRQLDLKGLVWTDVDVEALCALLAERLGAVVPEGIRVSVRHGLVFVSGAGTDVARIVSDSEGSVDERLVEAAERLLEVASESISEVTADPWPADAGMFAGGFPPSHAEISNDELRVFYGEPEEPLLVLAPIRIPEVLRDRGSELEPDAT